MPPNMPAEKSLPSVEIRNTVIEKVEALITAIEAHAQWTPPKPHQSLYHVWDFVQRTRYMATELDKIQAGQPLLYPQAMPAASGGGTSIVYRL